MRAIAILCLFFVLISTGTALRCKHCSSRNRFICKHVGGSTCSASKIGCLGAIGETNFVPEINYFQNFYKCASVQDCLQGDFSITAADKKFLHMGSYCCKSEQCNAHDPEYVPYKDLKPNGRQCPACFSDTDKTTCNPKEMVNCVGNQTQCVNMRAKFNYQIYAALGFRTIKGCATPDVCARQPGDFYNLGSVVIFNQETNCYEATPSSDQPDLGAIVGTEDQDPGIFH